MQTVEKITGLRVDSQAQERHPTVRKYGDDLRQANQVFWWTSPKGV